MFVGKDGGEVCESLSVSGAGHLVLMEHKARGILDIWLKKTNKKTKPTTRQHSQLYVGTKPVYRKEKKKSSLACLERVRWCGSCRSSFATSPDLALRLGDPNPPSGPDLPLGIAILTALPPPTSIPTLLDSIKFKRTERVVK